MRVRSNIPQTRRSSPISADWKVRLKVGSDLAARGDFLEHLDAVRDGSGHEAQALDGALRFAGQANHERFFHYDGQAAGEDRIASQFERFHSHGFSKAGQFSHRDLSNGFGRDISQGDARAARSQNQVTTLVDLFPYRSLDRHFFVWNQQF